MAEAFVNEKIIDGWMQTWGKQTDYRFELLIIHVRRKRKLISNIKLQAQNPSTIFWDQDNISFLYPRAKR